jgi:hypothetical protein
MRTVAEGGSFRVFALAPGHGFGLANINFHGRELGSFMGTVAKGLFLGLAAGAPIVGSCFGLLNRRRFLSDNWSFHRQFDG